MYSIELGIWADSDGLWPVNFEGCAENVAARIESMSIGPARISPAAHTGSGRANLIGPFFF